MCFYNNAWLETENASAPPFLIYSTPADHTDKHIIKVKGENQTGSIYTPRIKAATSWSISLYLPARKQKWRNNPTRTQWGSVQLRAANLQFAVAP